MNNVEVLDAQIETLPDVNECIEQTKWLKDSEPVCTLLQAGITAALTRVAIALTEESKTSKQMAMLTLESLFRVGFVLGQMYGRAMSETDSLTRMAGMSIQ